MSNRNRHAKTTQNLVVLGLVHPLKKTVYFEVGEVNEIVKRPYLIWVFPQIGVLYPKMDGENNGSKPYEQMG